MKNNSEGITASISIAKDENIIIKLFEQTAYIVL